MFSQYGELGPLMAEIGWRVLGLGSKLQQVSRFNQQHSTEGATYIRLGGHNFGHRPSF